MNVDTAFRAVYGRDASAEETSRFNRIGKELGIHDNDAIWAITFLLGHHLELAKQMPEQIEKQLLQSLNAFNTMLIKTRKVAEADFVTTKVRIEESLSQAVVSSTQKEIARAAQAVARDTARKSWLQWLGGAAVAGMMLMGGAFYWGYGVGNASGYARSLDVKAASSWGASAVGVAAYQLDQNGDLNALIRCSRDGWRIEPSKDGKHKLCMVGATREGSTYGWYVP